MTVAAALAGRPSRELLLILVHRAGRPGGPRLVQRPGRPQRATPATSAPASPSPTAGSTRARCGSAWPSRSSSWCRSRSPTACTPGRRTSSRWPSAWLGQWVWLRKGFFSWLPWAAAYALYPAFLSYGGWGGQEKGAPPELLDHRAGRAARDRRAPAHRAVGAGARQRGRLDLPAAQARAAGSAPPGCCGWPAPTPCWCWSRWPSPAPMSGSRRSRSSAPERVH